MDENIDSGKEKKEKLSRQKKDFIGAVCELFVSIVSEALFAMLMVFVDIGVDAALSQHGGWYGT